MSAKALFLGCLSAKLVLSSLGSSGLILLPRYLMNGLSNLDEAYD